jgi:hypothetical protein
VTVVERPGARQPAGMPLRSNSRRGVRGTNVFNIAPVVVYQICSRDDYSEMASFVKDLIREGNCKIGDLK